MKLLLQPVMERQLVSLAELLTTHTLVRTLLSHLVN